MGFRVLHILRAWERWWDLRVPRLAPFSDLASIVTCDRGAHGMKDVNEVEMEYSSTLILHMPPKSSYILKIIAPSFSDHHVCICICIFRPLCPLRISFMHEKPSSLQLGKYCSFSGIYDGDRRTSNAFTAALDILAISTLALAPLFFSSVIRVSLRAFCFASNIASVPSFSHISSR